MMAIFVLSVNAEEDSQKKQTKPKKVVEKSEPARVEVVSTSSSLKKHSLGVGIGQTFLQRKFDRHGDDRVTGDIYYNYAASHSFDFVMNTHMSSHSSNGEKLNLFGLNASIKSKFFDFDNFAPYLLGGLGFYRPKATRNTGAELVETRGKYTFGFNLGAGVDLRLNENYLVGIIGHFHKPFKVEQDNQADLKGSYFKLLLLIMYTF